MKIKYFLCIRIYWFWKIYYFWKYFFEPQAIITEMNGILRSKLQYKVICLWKKKELTVILRILVYGCKRSRFHKKQEKKSIFTFILFSLQRKQGYFHNQDLMVLPSDISYNLKHEFGWFKAISFIFREMIRVIWTNTFSMSNLNYCTQFK